MCRNISDHPMNDLRSLSDEELARHASDWRQRALHGERSAGGIAHAFEAELRRRGGAGFVQAEPSSLDTRPEWLRNRKRAWWKIWGGRST